MQKNHKLLSKLYYHQKVLRSIGTPTWKTTAAQQKTNNQTCLENNKLRLPFVPSLLLEPPTDQKIASTEKGNTDFSPQTRWHLENGETLAMFRFKESWHAAAQSLWIGKEFVPIILGFFDEKDPGHFSKSSLYFFMFKKGDPAFSTSTFQFSVWSWDPSIWSFIAHTTSSECWPGHDWISFINFTRVECIHRQWLQYMLLYLNIPKLDINSYMLKQSKTGYKQYFSDHTVLLNYRHVTCACWRKSSNLSTYLHIIPPFFCNTAT